MTREEKAKAIALIKKIAPEFIRWSDEENKAAVETWEFKAAYIDLLRDGSWNFQVHTVPKMIWLFNISTEELIAELTAWRLSGMPMEFSGF